MFFRSYLAKNISKYRIKVLYLIYFGWFLKKLELTLKPYWNKTFIRCEKSSLCCDRALKNKFYIGHACWDGILTV